MRVLGVITAEPGSGVLELSSGGESLGMLIVVPPGVPAHMVTRRAIEQLHREMHQRDREFNELWPGWVSYGEGDA